jgi:hypothetical protein
MVVDRRQVVARLQQNSISDNWRVHGPWHVCHGTEQHSGTLSITHLMCCQSSASWQLPPMTQRRLHLGSPEPPAAALRHWSWGPPGAPDAAHLHFRPPLPLLKQGA